MLSKEEIEKGADEIIPIKTSDGETEYISNSCNHFFKEGVKWALEQIEKKNNKEI